MPAYSSCWALSWLWKSLNRTALWLRRTAAQYYFGWPSPCRGHKSNCGYRCKQVVRRWTWHSSRQCRSAAPTAASRWGTCTATDCKRWRNESTWESHRKRERRELIVCPIKRRRLALTWEKYLVATGSRSVGCGEGTEPPTCSAR